MRDVLNDSSDENFRIETANMISEISSITMPLYIGKADDINERVLCHVYEKNSSLIMDLKLHNIEKEDILLKVFYDTRSVLKDFEQSFAR